jgi:hypothetical protein
MTEGRIVHYVLEDGPSTGDHRPAIVVRIWDSESDCEGVNLQVFTDGLNDGALYSSGTAWKTSVPHSEEPKPGTWHWPEREPAKDSS